MSESGPETSARFLAALVTAADSSRAMQAAADEVRETLRCDVSWVGFAQPDGYLHIAADSGLRTAEMRTGWKLKVGTGIGGRAAELSRTLKTNDYRHDARRGPGKQFIDDEGIVTVLVVPIAAGDALFGVLYAAHRRMRTWTDDEVEYLERVGYFLAVRMTQLDGDRRAARQLLAFRQRATAVHSAMRSMADLLSELVGAEDIPSALEASATVLNARVELIVESGGVLYAAGPTKAACAGTPLRLHIDRVTGSALELTPVLAEPALADPPLRLGLNALGLLVLRLRERASTRESLRGELLDALLSGRIQNLVELARQLALIGHGALADGAQVLVVGPRADVAASRMPGAARAKPARARRASQLIDDLCATYPGALIGQRDSRDVIIVNTGDADAGERLRAILDRDAKRAGDGLSSAAAGDDAGVVIGVGRECASLDQICLSYDEARVACDVGITQRASAYGRVVSARSLGIQGLASMPRAQLEATVEDTFGAILSEDALNGTDLMATVRAYLANDRHIASTAEALHVHYNTVRNRITRIEELLDLSFADVDDRFRAETAIRMDAVLRTLRELA